MLRRWPKPTVCASTKQQDGRRACAYGWEFSRGARGLGTSTYKLLSPSGHRFENAPQFANHEETVNEYDQDTKAYERAVLE